MNRLILLCIFGLSFLFLGTGTVFAQEAASLSLVPATGVYPVGEEFTIEVRLDTAGVQVSTADATISYNPEDMSFVSVSGEGSIFNHVSQVVDSEKGEVSISGLVTGGQQDYVGVYGLVASITFMPKRNVATQLHFASGGARKLQLGASVGDALNILSVLNTATYTFVPRENTVASVQQMVAGDMTSKLEITPLPVPDGDWFATTTVKLSWTVPEGALEMRTLTTGDPSDMPTESYQIPVSSIVVDDLKEGTNYFLLQFKFASGDWDSVIQYPLQVDISDPDYITVREAQREDGADPRVSFEVEAGDSVSDISHFEMGIDGEPGEKWVKEERSDKYRPEELTAGEHVLTVTAFDNAGNSTSSDYVFLVSSLEPPTLTPESVPDRVLTGDTITVSGSSYPNAQVTTYISLNDGEASEKTVKTDGVGNFVVDITDGARAGKYTMWFSVTDERGATSPNSIRRSVTVTQPTIMLLGQKPITYLAVIVPLIALIVLLGLVLWLAYTWVRGYRNRVRHETGDAYYAAKGEFDKLRKELVEQIGMLEKANQLRELTREEMRIFINLSKRLDKMERHIIQEIEDIEVFDEDESLVEEELHSDKEGSLEHYREKVKFGEQKYDESHIIRL